METSKKKRLTFNRMSSMRKGAKMRKLSCLLMDNMTKMTIIKRRIKWKRNKKIGITRSKTKSKRSNRNLKRPKIKESRVKIRFKKKNINLIIRKK